MSDRVYIFKIKLDCLEAKYCYKIGKASDGKHNKRGSIDRLLEVQRSHFLKHRYTFFAGIIRDRPSEDAFAIETKLHQKFKDQQYYFSPTKKFDGCTEIFDVPEHVLLKAYDEMLPLK